MGIHDDDCLNAFADLQKANIWLQNHKKAHCHGTSGYDYRNTYHFCRRRPKGIQNLVIKMAGIFFRP